MQDTLLRIDWLPMMLVCGAALYALMAVLASLVSVSRAAAHERRSLPARAPMPVSVLKPLCGAEPRLFDNLATFCELSHPCFELICGVSSANDSAIAIVHRLQAAYPHCRISLVVDPRVHGTNLKVSNLINLAQWAHHDVFVIA